MLTYHCSQGVGKVKYAVQNRYIPPPSLEELRLPDNILDAVFLARFREGATKFLFATTDCTDCKHSNSTPLCDQLRADVARKIIGCSPNSLAVIAAGSAADLAAYFRNELSRLIIGQFTTTRSDYSSSIPGQMETRSSCGRDSDESREDLFPSHTPVSHITGKLLKQATPTQSEDKTSSPVTHKASSPLELAPNDFPFHNSYDPPTSDGAFSEISCSSFNSASPLSCTDLSYSSNSNGYYPIDPGMMAASSDFTVSSASLVFDLFGQSDCHLSNVLSQEFNKFNSMTTTYFSTPDLSSHALLTSSDASMRSSPESITDYQDSSPETLSLTLNPNDPLLQQQALSNVHDIVDGTLMDGCFNFDAVTYSQRWNNNTSIESTFLETSGNCSPYCLPQEPPSCRVSYSNTNQMSLEVQDILQQFM